MFSPVCTLAIEAGGIVDLPKECQQFVVADARRVIFHLANLCVTCNARQNIEIAGMLEMSSHISH